MHIEIMIIIVTLVGKTKSNQFWDVKSSHYNCGVLSSHHGQVAEMLTDLAASL